MRWQEWLAAGGNLLLGASCPGCGAPDGGVCPECRGRITSLHPVHRVWRSELPGLPAIWVAGYYAAPLDRLLIAHKDEGAWYLAGRLGRLAASAARKLEAADQSILVPVPSTPAVVRARGYDHARALARSTAAALGWRWAPLLRRVRATADQVGQRRSERLDAQIATMRARPGEQAVVLLDDIVTTGATCAEAVRALRSAGHRVLGVVAVCETPRRQVPI